MVPKKKTRKMLAAVSASAMLLYLVNIYSESSNISTLSRNLQTITLWETSFRGTPEQRVRTKTELVSRIHRSNISNTSRPENMVHFSYGINLNGTMTYGKPMEVPVNMYQEMNQWPKFVRLTQANIRQHVFATAASGGYFQQSRVAIASIQKHFPGYPIYYYNLGGLRENQISEIKTLCSVHLRTFQFGKFPNHVGTFKLNFAWKALLIRELLQEHPGVFYIDSSVRFSASYNDEHYEQVLRVGGFLFNTYTGHATFPVTHPAVFNFLPTNMTAMKTLFQWEGGDVIVYRTEEVCTKVMMPLLMCSLYESCAQPTKDISCSVKSWDTFSGCHRFDQSLMNILVQNYAGYNNLIRALPEVVVIHRSGVGDGPLPDQPSICDS